MAGSRTLKLSILADVDDLKKKLNEGSDEIEGFGAKLEKFGKAAAAAFAVAAAAAAAYATKLAIDGVKAALEDEQAQLRLSSALKAATGATDAQIKSTEDYISKMQLATGVSDNELRDSLQRLTVTTRDLNKSQDLLSLALDVSKGTGKDLASVTEALAKAYEGQDTKLARLGIGLSAADLKQQSFNETTKALSDLYGGAAARNAETFQGRIDRLKQGFDEAKEAVGYRLLPILQDLIDIVVNKIIPNIGKFIALFDPLKQAIIDNKETFMEFGRFLAEYIVPVLVTGVGGAIKIVATIAGGVVDIIGGIIRTIEKLIGGAIDGINAVIKAYNAIPLLGDISLVGKPTFSSGGSSTPSISTPAAPTLPSFPTSGVATAGQSGKQAATSLQSQTTSGMTAAQIAAAATAPVANTYNLYVSGAIDPEGTARAISSVLGDSSTRGGTGINYLGIPGLAF